MDANAAIPPLGVLESRIAGPQPVGAPCRPRHARIGVCAMSPSSAAHAGAGPRRLTGGLSVLVLS